ncbi:hypothetical protein O3G_MSEX006487 [Manduca sexta]|uniref:Uncharacterized protein n=1 Tax=Manduca sexta TaxID=7130 RepID=A0A921Z2L9_MANSE|nr:hypothetical protein O3G_MSEX006487 [Manduca sexta]
MSTNCSGCGNKIESLRYMKCSVCSELYDLECLKITDTNFKQFDRAFKSKWLCPACTCTRPKRDNSSTPVRSQSSSQSNNNILCDNFSPNDYVNKTRGSRMKSASSYTAHEPENTFESSLLHEITQLKTELTGLKKQNSDMENKLTSVSDSLQQILNEYMLRLKEKDNEISSLKNTIIQLQGRLNKQDLYKNVESDIGMIHNRERQATKPVKTITKPKKNGTSLDVSSCVATNSNSARISCPDKSVIEETNAQDSTNNMATSTETSEWKQVTHKRMRHRTSNILRGTAVPGSTTLEAASRSIYLHLYYVKLGTSENEVLSHLKCICPSDAYIVEALKARGNYASFKLEVPAKFSQHIMSTENWAEGICVKLWKQNFRSKKSQEGKKSN